MTNKQVTKAPHKVNTYYKKIRYGIYIFSRKISTFIRCYLQLDLHIASV